MHYVDKFMNFVSRPIVELPFIAAAGYVSAIVFAPMINPVNAAAFTAIAALVSLVTRPLFDLIFERKSCSASTKFLGKVLNFGTAIGIAVGIASLAGFPMTFTGGLIAAGSLFAGYLVCRIVIDLVESIFTHIAQSNSTKSKNHFLPPAANDLPDTEEPDDEIGTLARDPV